MKINFSIPVALFDFRESENSLYSYAKLKIFYVGETGDKRLFTKEFSDRLLSSLPYVPVVGYYDEEKEDFLGHNPSIQHIYGVVPEDTAIEYVKEDGKEYAVCDVILYTGRVDKTGEIAQKIVGKQHSLELNPTNTTFVINRDQNGKMINIEFKSGTLLGLSILGDDEKPAFGGSEFFNEQSFFIQMFNGFKEQLASFAKNKNVRGDTMNLETGIDLEKDKITPLSFEGEGDPVDQGEGEDGNDNPENGVGGEGEGEGEGTGEGEGEGTGEGEGEGTGEGEGEGEGEDPKPARQERKNKEGGAISDEGAFKALEFIRETDGEKQDFILAELQKHFGEYLYIVQSSAKEKTVVYVDYNGDNWEAKLLRINYTEEADGIKWGEPVEVKARFLTEDEINALWSSAGNTGYKIGGTNDNKPEIKTSEEVNEKQFKNEDSAQDLEKNSATALNESERAELEAFRRERKVALIKTFKEDLHSEILEKLISEVDSFTYDELEIELSKEFTKVMKGNNKNKQKTFIYTGPTQRAETKAELVSSLVAKYKNKN